MSVFIRDACGAALRDGLGVSAVDEDIEPRRLVDDACDAPAHFLSPQFVRSSPNLRSYP